MGCIHSYLDVAESLGQGRGNQHGTSRGDACHKEDGSQGAFFDTIAPAEEVRDPRPTSTSMR